MRSLQCWLVLFVLLPLSSLAQAVTDDDTLLIEALSCRGNVATSCDFILGYVYLAPGDRVDEEELDNARLRLATLPSFQAVDVYLERGTARGRVHVVIEVTEADPFVREWLAGASWRFDSPALLLAGQLTNQNLLGTGKLLDLLVYAYTPIDGLVRSEYGGRLEYIDPRWLDTKRVFLIAGASGAYVDQETINRDRYQVDTFGMYLKVGRRIFDFSYLSLGYRYNARIDVEHSLRHLDGSFERRHASFDEHVVAAEYGWNSEDDPYFPTRGSRAIISWSWVSTAHDMVTDGGFRKTWTTEGGTSWRVQVADTPGTEFRAVIDEHFDWVAGFARPLSASLGGEIQRGRWYVDVGYTPLGNNLRGEHQKEYGVKAGVRLQTRSFGLVDLYIIASGMHTDRSERRGGSHGSPLSCR